MEQRGVTAGRTCERLLPEVSVDHPAGVTCGVKANYVASKEEAGKMAEVYLCGRHTGKYEREGWKVRSVGKVY